MSSVWLCGAAALLMASAAGAAELQQIGTIKVPGEPINNFDVSFVDQATGKYYLADRSNSAVDVFDVMTDSYVTRFGAFKGAVMKNGKVNNAVSGPDGVLAMDGRVWVGDGDSAVTVFDAATLKPIAKLSSGGTTRLDEMAIDPVDHVFIGVNNAEDPPYITLLSTEGDHASLGQLAFTDAMDGVEQPAFNSADGFFYVAIPQIGKDPRKGGVAVVSPRSLRLMTVIPVEGCHPAGFAFGPNGNFVLGCNADGKEMPAETLIMNARSGRVIATIEGLGGADMVNYNKRNNQYYTASRTNPGGPVLGVIDAETNTLVQKIPIAGGYPHSVASSEANGHVYVPVGTVNGGDGTVHVYAPKS